MTDETNKTANTGDNKAAAADKPEAAPEAAPPDPRQIEAEALLARIRETVEAAFTPSPILEASVMKYRPTLRIENARWLEVIDFLRTEPSLRFNYPRAMAGTDYVEYIEIVVYLYSMEHGYFLCAKTRTERDGGTVPSLTPIFNGFNWEEREIYDLLGVTFTGHPDLRRIMMPDDWKGHPLRKDYSPMD